MPPRKNADLDDEIISLIEQDGRASYREMAAALAISERQVASRVRRMIDEEVIRLITVVDAYAIGFQYVLAIGVTVSGRPAVDVARDLADQPNVIAVAVMAGEFDIEICVALEEHADLAHFFTQSLAAIEGVAGLHPSLFLDVVKYETGAGAITASSGTLSIPGRSSLDEVDRAIIEALWRDASSTNDDIAGALGVSESTVRKRVARLRRDDLVHITSMRNVALGREVMFASVGLELEAARREEVIETIRGIRQVHLLAQVLGRYDLLLQLLVSDPHELSALVNGVIAGLPGVRRVRAALASDVLKYDYRWRIVGPISRSG